ncbi:hypothetical protein AAVH_29401 [Aphelenchoides avenae]|nr:hypothetical protein AAVH_29401 [Aphelenchus avenae]
MLHAYRISLLLFDVLAGVNVALGDTQEVVQKVEEIQRRSLEYLSGPAYERIGNFPNNSASIIDLYASFGQLFLNGQLGTCEKEHLCHASSAPTVVVILN